MLLKMKSKILSSIIGLSATIASVLTLTPRTLAFSLVDEDGNFNNLDRQIVGIQDLSIEVNSEEQLFDVEFFVDSFNNAFNNIEDVSILEGDTPTFWNEENNARNATLAIIDALGNEAFTISEGNDIRSQLDSFFVPYAANSTDNSELQAFFDAPQLSEDSISTGSILNLNSSLFFPIAKFQESTTAVVTSVPEPLSTITVFFLTSMGLLASRSRKKS